MPRFSLRTLLLTVAICAVGLGAGSSLFRKVVTFRPPRPGDEVGQQELSSPLSNEEARNILYAKGKFDRWTRCHISLTAVRSGRLQVQTQRTLWPNPHDRVSIPSSFETMLVLRTRQTPIGKLTCLDHRGPLLTGGSHREREQEIASTSQYSFTGAITPGRRRIVYVEGDSAIEVSDGMTMEQFAERNPGNYFVVMAEIE